MCNGKLSCPPAGCTKTGFGPSEKQKARLNCRNEQTLTTDACQGKKRHHLLAQIFLQTNTHYLLLWKVRVGRTYARIERKLPFKLRKNYTLILLFIKSAKSLKLAEDIGFE